MRNRDINNNGLGVNQEYRATTPIAGSGPYIRDSKRISG